MIKKIIYYLLAYLIHLNLYLIKKKNKSKLIHPYHFSFGDTFVFYITHYNLINSQKKKVVVFSNLDKKIAELFFYKDQIYKLFIFLPKFISIYPLNYFLKKKKYFKIKKNLHINYANKYFKKKHKHLLNNILRKNYKQVNSNIKLFKKKKFVLILIKHNNKNSNDISGSQTRQTADFTKIFLIIKYILKKNLKVVILGNQKDKSVNIIENHLKDKNLFFFKNLSPKQTMIDQLFLHKYSQFGVGNDSGGWMISFFLQKKLLLFDTCIFFGNKMYRKYKNIFFISKKIAYENKTVDLTYKIIVKILKNKIPYKVIEVPLEQIIKKLKKIL